MTCPNNFLVALYTWLYAEIFRNPLSTLLPERTHSLRSKLHLNNLSAYFITKVSKICTIKINSEYFWGNKTAPDPPALPLPVAYQRAYMVLLNISKTSKETKYFSSFMLQVQYLRCLSTQKTKLKLVQRLIPIKIGFWLTRPPRS